ncbi:MAG: PD-(D/E)XK nuclease family protein [Anaerolineales bacterium]|nr:PD-(D/E)XK nuclease family protein [Anaerolineales bacterium]
MLANLYLSPTTSTAFNHLINRIRAIKDTDILTPVTLLLPTADVIQDMRGQLGDTMGVQMFQFYRLGNAVLNEAGIPIHEINDTAVRRLIRRILWELNAEGLLTTFAPVWEKPGFVEVILDWVRELKSQGIFPEDYAEYAQVAGTERDHQLAEIYLRYQTFMQGGNYSDPDGLLWVTAEALEGDPALFRQDGPIFVLGFDQFTPIQIRILGKLAERCTELTVYLLWDENRSEDSLALARLRRTRESLLDGLPMEITMIPEEQPSPPSLEHLHQSIFDTSDHQTADNEYLRLIEAPSREAEVRQTLREVKRLLIEGISPSEISFLTPNKNAYLPIIRTVSTEYGVPVEYERPLMGNPAVAALVNLLKLPSSFPWGPTFDTLRSPYIHQSWLTEEQIDLLDQLSRERPVIAGRDQWAFAMRSLDLDALDSEDDDLGPPPLVATLDPDTLAGIQEGMTAFFDHLTPPAKATYRDYTWWLQTAIIGYFPEPESEEEQAAESEPTLDLVGCCRGGPFNSRDMEALNLVMRALRRLLASAETVPVDTEIHWETYRDELLLLLRVMQIPPDPLQANVRFARMEEGRARVVDYLFVLGLSEGEFPKPPPPDTLYAPYERENHPLPLIRYSPADDASLWWQVISNVNQRLILSRPYIDDNGAPWQASPYWDAVSDCFSELEAIHIPIADHPSPENAASQSELLVGLAQTGARTIPSALQTHWAYAQNAEAIIHQRNSYNPPGEYEGVLASASLKDELAGRFGDGHVWSASRLNRYANCPYGFFAEHVLKLEARQDPEEGLNALQRGSLLHAILENLYGRLTDMGIAPTESNQETIIHLLEECCDEVYPSAPQRYGFRPSALWEYEQQELFRLLRALAIWECETNGPEARFMPYLQEAGFGIGREGPPPLEIVDEQPRVRLRGLIDRIDRDHVGNLRVIDYKSGSSTWSKTDMQIGLALQTALYALAAERYWVSEGGRIAESHYLHIPSRNTSGKLSISGAVQQDGLAEEIIQQAIRSAAMVRAGVFPSAPGKPVQGGMQCSSRCDFAPICRVTRCSIVKARRGGLA